MDKYLYKNAANVEQITSAGKMDKCCIIAIFLFSSALTDEQLKNGGNKLNTSKTIHGEVPPYNGKQEALMERLDKNIEDFRNSLMSFDKPELIDMASKITAMSDAHAYLSYHSFRDDELDFFLQFQNPLEVFADTLCGRELDLNEMKDVLYGVVDNQDLSDYYPLIHDLAEVRAVPERKAPEKPSANRSVSIGHWLKSGNQKVKAYKEQRAQNQQAAAKNNDKGIE